MPATRNLIDREVFESIMEEGVRRLDGTKFRDLKTAYGDLSRLVVAILLTTPAEELEAIYKKVWPSEVNLRQSMLAARFWLEKYHEGKFPATKDEPDLLD